MHNRICPDDVTVTDEDLPRMAAAINSTLVAMFRWKAMKPGEEYPDDM